MSDEGKIAVVTGANRGLGRGLTEALAERGFTVLMVCRNAEAGRAVEDELKGRGLDVRLFVADMESAADIERLAGEVAADYDRVDVLVNNAAVNLDDEQTTIETMPLEALERTLAVNVVGPFWMCRMFLPLLRKSESGRVINYTSGLGRLGIPRSNRMPSYSLSKTAINALTVLLAAEGQGDGIIVNSVDPGWVKTEMGGPGAQLELAEGIQAALHLATAPAEELQTGCLYHQREILSW